MAEDDLDRAPRLETPTDYDSFLRLQEIEIEQANLQRYKRIKEIVGSSTNAAELEQAADLVEEEILTDIRQKNKTGHQPNGLLTIIPPEPENGKGIMISLYSDDPATLSTFNLAASEATEKNGGFNQVGGRNKTGLSSWELRTGQIPRSDELIKATFEAMKKMNPGRN